MALDLQSPSIPGLRRFGGVVRSPSGLVGLSLTVVFLGTSIAAALGWLPYDPLAQDTTQRLAAPSSEHVMGTDQFGRDIFSRVAAGIANSMQVSILAIAIAASVGTLAGVAAGYFRGWTDGAVRGVSDVLLAFPSLLLALALASVLERNWITVSIAIALVYVPLFVRVARAPVLSLREVEFVVAAKSTGMGSMRILSQHILPNIGNVLLVQATLALNWAILTAAALSFLGFGTPPPAPSLGVMIFESRALFTIAPWVLLGPGLGIVLLVVGLNLLGDALQTVLDPAKNRNAMTKELDDSETMAVLTTEGRDPRFSDLDTMEVAELVGVMNQSDFTVPAAVRKAIPSITVAIEAMVGRLAQGGRLIYVGAGSSGRIGVLDASEIPPTFGTEPGVVVGIIAGGRDAFAIPREGAEDSPDGGTLEIDERDVGPLDTVVGIASSGRTPFVLGAVDRARERGALTIGLSCNRNTPLSLRVDYPIEVIVGPEIISGSTRLKAGTAQKLVLNMISTISMIRLGRTYGNYMVDVRPTNAKLRERAIRIVSALSQIPLYEAEKVLANSNYAVKPAVLASRLGIAIEDATDRLDRVGGNLRAALEEAQ